MCSNKIHHSQTQLEDYEIEVLNFTFPRKYVCHPQNVDFGQPESKLEETEGPLWGGKF